LHRTKPAPAIAPAAIVAIQRAHRKVFDLADTEVSELGLDDVIFPTTPRMAVVARPGQNVEFKSKLAPYREAESTINTAPTIRWYHAGTS